MKSGKQRRAELVTKRQARASEAEAAEFAAKERERRAVLAAKEQDGVAVNPSNLAPDNSYDVPEFVKRGFYIDQEFQCAGCGRVELWSAAQQKWWYEIAKGYVYSTAKLCRACRRQERERRAAARRIHLEGLARKSRVAIGP